jgi:hypothetical protein
MKNKNIIYEDYTKTLIQTFFKYSFKDPQTKNNNKSNLSLSNDNINNNSNSSSKNSLRIFPFEVKEKCWNDSPIISNRDPNRWRLDALGNPVMKSLRGFQGIFCHEYDHIFPFSLGGTSTLDNCQILQTNINRKKGNQFFSNNMLIKFKQPIPESLKKIGINCVDNRLMDIAEELVYGNINKC